MSNHTTTRGIIYILSNPHIPGVVKIGRTGRTAAERAKELSKPSGVPAAFEVVFEAVVSHAKEAESDIHRQLSAWRVNQGREFFRMNASEAIKRVRTICNRYPANEDHEARVQETLPEFEARMRRWLRRDLVSVQYVQYPDLCLARLIYQPDFRSPDAVETIFDLTVFGEDDTPCPDGHLFCAVHRSFADNLSEFLTIGAVTMMAAGPGMLSREAARHIREMHYTRREEVPFDVPWQVVETEFETWDRSEYDLRKALSKEEPEEVSDSLF